ncbi:hypothetical protein SAMN05661044_01146 [Olivibacter domesticus]|uniref:Uncharacterized protein n=1 Tax=Olivibacter domesticus TaxID=407022 RepID=A0A1H7JWK9_OLID1|nr:hypothetical protein SAMN05661044_01146 [Olivibacter domesticus]
MKYLQKNGRRPHAQQPLHLKAKHLLDNGRVMDACKVLLM